MKNIVIILLLYKYKLRNKYKYSEENIFGFKILKEYDIPGTNLVNWL